MESIPSPLYPAIALHPSLLSPSLVSHIMTFSPTVPYPLRYCVSRCHVIHVLYALAKEVIHFLLSPLHSIIIIGISLSVTILFSFVP